MRIQRLGRDEGLRVVKKAKKDYRIGVSTVPGTRLRPPDPAMSGPWTSDQITDLRTLNILNVTDEFTKEALGIEVDRSSIGARPHSGCPPAFRVWRGMGHDRDQQAYYLRGSQRRRRRLSFATALAGTGVVSAAGLLVTVVVSTPRSGQRKDRPRALSSAPLPP